jgi:hypothetical protein
MRDVSKFPTIITKLSKSTRKQAYPNRKMENTIQGIQPEKSSIAYEKAENLEVMIKLTSQKQCIIIIQHKIIM